MPNQKHRVKAGAEVVPAISKRQHVCLHCNTFLSVGNACVRVQDDGTYHPDCVEGVEVPAGPGWGHGALSEATRCGQCNGVIKKGADGVWVVGEKGAFHLGCVEVPTRRKKPSGTRESKYKVKDGADVAPAIAQRATVCLQCRELVKEGTNCTWVQDEGVFHLHCVEGGPEAPKTPERESPTKERKGAGPLREYKRELLEGCTELCVKVLVRRGTSAEKCGNAVMTGAVSGLEGFVTVHASYADSPDGDEVATFLDILNEDLEGDDIDWDALAEDDGCTGPS